MENQEKHLSLKRKLFIPFIALGLVLILSFASMAAEGFEMSTNYPGISAKPGDNLNFALDFANGGSGVNAALSAGSVPDGWKGYFEGNGNQISNVYVKNGASAALATFNVEIPDNAANGSYTINLNAVGSGVSSSIQLTLNISQEDIGSSKLTTDYAEQEGASGGSFKFNTTVQNNSANKQSFGFSSTQPDGWKVTFLPSGQTNAVSAVDVDAHGSQTMAVTVTPPQDVAAGNYSIPVSAVSGSETLNTELKVKITGKYELKVQTPNQVLNFDATASKKKSVTVDVVNNGNIALQNINLSAEAPTDWVVEFSESTIDTLEAGATKEVTMNVTPSKDAISGDYVYNVTAKSSDASDTETFRTTVKTQTSWGIFAVVLIAAIVGFVALIFRKFGRH